MSANPSSQACLLCRSRHLKCDAKQPSCTRCVTGNSDCFYLQSRRGYVGGRRKQTRQITQPASQIASDSPGLAHLNNGPLLGDHRLSEKLPQTPSSNSTVSLPRSMPRSADDDHLINAYYSHIHPAHPFVIPYSLYKKNTEILPEHLKRAMRLIASHVVAPTTCCSDSIEDITNSHMTSDGFKVQTYLLATITCYACCDREQGSLMLREAIDAAINMNLQSEKSNEDESSILRESWLRTWWELYTITTLIRVVTPSTPEIEVLFDTALPSHDSDYNEGRTTEHRTLNDLQDRFFTASALPYSSFAYRIEAARMLDCVLVANARDDFLAKAGSSFTGTSASIKSYVLSLPISTQDPSPHTDNRPDELLSSARMIINLATMLLQLPYSNLTNVQTFSTICTTNYPPIHPTSQTILTDSALQAANEISKLLIDRAPASFGSLSPCISCIIACSTTIQLAAYALGTLTQSTDRSHELKEYIQLSLCTLDMMGRNWPVAKSVKGQLAVFAREILKRPTSNARRRDAQGQNQRHNYSYGYGRSSNFNSSSDFLALEDMPVSIDLQDEFCWLREFVDDPRNYAFAAQGEL